MSITALIQLSAWLVICVVALASFGYGSVVGRRRALESMRKTRAAGPSGSTTKRHGQGA